MPHSGIGDIGVLSAAARTSRLTLSCSLLSLSCCPTIHSLTMTSIPLDTHPHILDAMLAHAPYPALLALRAASRTLRDRVDSLLLPHIAFLGDDLRAVWRGKHVRIPRAEWWDVPTLADAVRTVDLAGGPEEAWTAHATKERCWCGGAAGDPRAANLHRVQLVRQWTRDHRCAKIAAPRTVTFLPPGKPVYESVGAQLSMAPVAVFHCAPGALRCDVGGISDVVVRAQRSKENAVDPTILCLDLARALALADRVTLVGWAELPFLRAWACGDVQAQIERVVTTELVVEHYVEEEEAPDILREHLRMISEDEYRAEVGEEVYALEAYCAPPSGAWRK